MKGSRNLVALAGAALLLAVSAFAAGTGKGTLHVYESVDVRGKQLAPGEYKLQWNGEGPKVELNITSSKRTVVSVPAQLIPVGEAYTTDGYAAKKSEDGKNALTEIFFHGKSYELRLVDQAGGEASQPGATGSSQ
jgi:hypothetical protein